MAPRVDAMSFVVRTSVTPGALTEPVRRAIGEVDPNLALGQLRTLQESLDRAAAQMASTMALLVIAASVSLMLGVIGIYAQCRTSLPSEPVKLASVSLSVQSREVWCE